MLSLEQVKHIITYYFLDMLDEYEKSIPVHIQRDCVFLNKSRGEICADICSNPMLHAVIRKIHHANDIHQINSVPINSMCAIEKKKIPIESAGIQFIIYGDEKKEHICVQKKYQQLCYYYFKLRNFTTYTQTEILKWLNRQPWYLPKAIAVNEILKRLLESNFPEIIHRELNEIVDVLNSY